MNPFPAIVIGGPPHSGKSVLTYLLTQQLRSWGVEHYVLRACPDGEGDWSQEAPPDQVRLLRQKGAFSAEFVDLVCRDLAQRHLPLIVDVGGKPTPDQERILDQCTHAVLISATPEGLAEWRERAERHGLPVIAELHSMLDGNDRIDAETPVLRGQIGRLERHTGVAGPMTLALAQRLQQILSYTEAELKSYHLSHAPTELVIDIDHLAQRIGLLERERRWQPDHLPAALEDVPSAPLSIYGRGPNWLYAALALHAAPHPVYLFDPRLGWIAPVTLSCTPSAAPAAIAWKSETYLSYTWIEVQPGTPYLDYDEVNGAELPKLDPQRGIVLSGKIPLWLTVGACLAYRCHPWLAVVQAQQYDLGIIVTSEVEAYHPGSVVALRGNR
ncbi:MAG: CRISPR-associated protein Csx3 [Roseiflexaceae bacterium]|nr:CRISPR-associated protein Csx3 [Roseiflexaceae bacterium]